MIAMPTGVQLPDMQGRHEMSKARLNSYRNLPIQYWVLFASALILGATSIYLSPWSSDYDPANLSAGETLGAQVFKYFFVAMLIVSTITILGMLAFPGRFKDARVQQLSNQTLGAMIAIYVIILALGSSATKQAQIYEGFWVLPFTIVILVARPICELFIELVLPVGQRINDTDYR